MEQEAPDLTIKQWTSETPPTEPVVPCIHCGKDFVWWVHPVQLCDNCVDLTYDVYEVYEGNGNLLNVIEKAAMAGDFDVLSGIQRVWDKRGVMHAAYATKNRKSGNTTCFVLCFELPVRGEVMDEGDVTCLVCIARAVQYEEALPT